MGLFSRLRRGSSYLGRSYETQVAAGLDEAFADAAHCLHYDVPFNFDSDLGTHKLVCVSDLHRGKRDGADDHRRGERTYNAALAWYLGMGYHLAVLGDAEDLWEGSPEEVLGTPATASERGRLGYRRSLELENEFNRLDRYLRLWGNHDSLWRDSSQVASWLQPFFETPVRVHGAATITVGGAIGAAVSSLHGQSPVLFLAHGHQGTLDSDLFAPESGRAVRLWAWLQAKVGAWTAMPSEDWALRDRHSVAMYEWALHDERRPILIAGHTHEPVFATTATPGRPSPERWAELETELSEQWPPTEESASRAAGLELVLGEFRRQDGLGIGLEQKRPCYFDTGACCFGDGELTAIEVGEGEIRLVRWAWRNDAQELESTVLARADLESVFNEVLGDTNMPPPLSKPFDMNVPHVSRAA